MDPGSGRFLRSDDILNLAREVNLLPHDRASKKRRASVNASVRMRVLRLVVSLLTSLPSMLGFFVNNRLSFSQEAGKKSPLKKLQRRRVVYLVKESRLVRSEWRCKGVVYQSFIPGVNDANFGMRL